jgi:hypothetical protein
MYRNLAVPNIDFSDAEFRSFNLSEDNVLYIYLTSWDEKLLTITFFRPIYFLYQLGHGISNIYSINENSKLIQDAMNKYYVKTPQKYLFKLYEIIDLDDFPFIQIVAESIEVNKGKDVIGFK